MSCLATRIIRSRNLGYFHKRNLKIKKKLKNIAKSTKQGDIVVVRWYDAWSNQGWKDIDLAMDSERAIIDSVGTVIKVTPDYLVLVGMLTQDRTTRSVTQGIPLVNIVSLKKLASLDKINPRA